MVEVIDHSFVGMSHPFVKKEQDNKKVIPVIKPNLPKIEQKKTDVILIILPNGKGAIVNAKNPKVMQPLLIAPKMNPFKPMPKMQEMKDSVIGVDCMA